MGEGNFVVPDCRQEVYLNNKEATLLQLLVSSSLQTRTSSPVQISRSADPCECTSLRGLYPIGEGAGYAGGIVSAAVGGMYSGFAWAKCLGLFHGSIELILGKAQSGVFIAPKLGRPTLSMSGKEPMKEDSEESPMSISEEKEPSPMSEEAESSTRTMPQGFLPQPPPPQISSPVPRYIRGNRPPPPVPSAFEYLYIRGPDGPLDDAMVKRLRLTTVCPTSLAWIIYLSAVKKAKLHIQFETSVITDDTGSLTND
ncbi:hypothetical protein BC332_17985 [Capsicum chinense]|nr:hypothetical protein BC332_17985 [Capsicum chinense]